MSDRLVLSVDQNTIIAAGLGRSTFVEKQYSEYWCNRFFGDFEEIRLVWKNDFLFEELIITEFYVEELKPVIRLWMHVPRKVLSKNHFWWDSFKEKFPDVWNSSHFEYSLEKFSMWMSEGEGKYSANRHDVSVLFCEKYGDQFGKVSKETVYRAFWAYRCSMTEFYVNWCFVDGFRST